MNISAHIRALVDAGHTFTCVDAETSVEKCGKSCIYETPEHLFYN